MGYEVVGQAVGDTAHLALAGGAVTLCGIAFVGWLRKRFFMPNQTDCQDCIEEYLRHKGKDGKYRDIKKK